ncbi:MAG: ATP-binding protein, partial [Candidatus Zixiibacteriota bacterium]
GRDEMAQLANHFNTMTASLKDAQQQIIQSERLAATGKLAASLAHEINNPLQAIENFISLMIEKSEENSDNELREYLELSQEGIDRIAHIVKQLRDFYRPEAQTLTSVDINLLLDKVLTFLKNQLSLHDILVQKEFDSHIPEVYASPQQLYQVFTNLILNAQEAMPGGGQLTVKTSVEDGKVRIAFSDTGYGIKEMDLEHLFEPFFTTKEIGKGTGLGLSVSYGIIRAHDGNIEVKSRTGEGSTFTVVLPAI